MLFQILSHPYFVREKNIFISTTIFKQFAMMQIYLQVKRFQP